jgi:NAD(P)-dependent dehydrogenase (short-subunit alcohol dehydrogenase family)
VSRALDGRVAAVTGGSGGIGSAIVADLRGAGATVCPIDLRGDDPDWIAADVSDETSIADALAEAERRHGRLDLLVYAAGVSSDAVVWKLSVSEFDRVIAVNLRGAFLAIHHAVPRLRRAGGGRIVLIGSINGSRGKFGTSAYSASKAGLIALARSVARETGRFGIRVNVVEPGWVNTPLTQAVPPQIVEAAIADSAIGRILEPIDVARVVTFLCGPGGEAITGQIVRVDGGQHMG